MGNSDTATPVRAVPSLVEYKTTFLSQLSACHHSHITTVTSLQAHHHSHITAGTQSAQLKLFPLTVYGSPLELSVCSLESGILMGKALFSVMSRSDGDCCDGLATEASRCAASSGLTLMTVNRSSFVERRIMSTTAPCLSPSALSPFLKEGTPK